MKNPLSYVTEGNIFTGKEINDWCHSQLHKAPAYAAREARRLLRKNYKDDRLYTNEWTCRDSGSGSPLMMVFRRYKEE
jgi:hypothetical protein